MPLWDGPVAAVIRALSWALQRLPESVGIAVALVAGRLWYALDYRHRRVARDNLRHAFGDALDDAGREEIVRNCFRNVALTAVEFLTLPRWDFEGLMDHGTLEHVWRVDEAIAAGTGAILLGSHFGNWEILAAGSARRGIPISAVARPLDQPAIGAAITDIREASGLKMLVRRGGALSALRTLRKGGALGILGDQNTRKDHVFVEFFGRPAATTPAPAFLALKMGAPIFPCYTIRVGTRRFRTIVNPPIPLVQTGDMEHDVLVNTQLCVTELEHMIRKYPGNWFWIHRRWKTQPPPGWTPPHVPQEAAEALSAR